MERVKFKKVALLLLFVMLLNSITVLADVKLADDKLKLSISFDVVGEKGSLFDGDKQTVNLEIDSNGEISENDILTNDAILFDLPSSIFVIREKLDSESSAEYSSYILSEKKKNTGKLYYIDAKRVREIWSKNFINFDSFELNNQFKVKFRIDGKKFDQSSKEYTENIIFNIGNKTLLKNEYFVDTKSDEKYNKGNKDLVSIMGYYNESGNNLYRKDIRSNKIPRANMTAKDLKEFIDKKNEVFHELKDNHNFNLVGYSISGGFLYSWLGTSDDKVVKIAESEYELIELTGIDRFVFLKSNKAFRGFSKPSKNGNTYIYNYRKDDDIKYTDMDKYKFTYEFQNDEMIIGYIGDISSLSSGKMTKTEEEAIKQFLKNWNVKVGQVNREFIQEAGLDTKNIKESYNFIDDEVEKIKVIYNLQKEEIGSNITNEILMGTFNENKVKDDNASKKPELQANKEIIDRAITNLKDDFDTINVNALLYSKSGQDNLTIIKTMDEKIIPFSINMAERFETSRHYEYRKELIDNYYQEMQVSGILKNKAGIVAEIEKIALEEEKIAKNKIKLNIEKDKLVGYEKEAKEIVEAEEVGLNLSLISKLADLEITDSDEEQAGLKTNVKKFNSVDEINAEASLSNVKRIKDINEEINKANENIDKLNELEDDKKLEVLGNITTSILDLNEDIDGQNGINKEILELNVKINDINNNLSSINTNIANTNATIGSLENSINDSETAIEDAKNSIDIAIGDGAEGKEARAKKEKEMLKDFAKYKGHVDYYLSEFKNSRTIMETAENDLDELDETASEEEKNAAEKKFKDAKESLKDVEEQLMKELGELETIVATIKYYMVEVEKNDGKIEKGKLDERIIDLKNKRSILRTSLEKSKEDVKSTVKFTSGDFDKFLASDYLDISTATTNNLDTVKTELGKYNGLNVGIEGANYNLESDSKVIIDLIDKLKLELEKPVENQEDIDGKLNEINDKIDSFNIEKNKVKAKSSEIKSETLEAIKNDGTTSTVDVESLINKINLDLDNIGKIKYEEDGNTFTIDNISTEKYDPAKDIKNDDLANGVNFQLVYKPSKNNETDGNKLEGVEDFNRIPWIKYEKIKNIETIDPEDRKTDKYNYLDIDHIGGYYKNGKGELSGERQRYGDYWMFNPSISGDGSKDKLMKVKAPKDLKLLINMDSIAGELENKRPFAEGYNFELKLAYVRVDSEDGTDFIFRNELENKKSKETSILTLKDGNLYIYQNSKDKLVDIEDPKASEIKDEDIKKLIKVTLVFEDELNREYIVKYQDKNGKDILEPALIKGLIGTTFNVNAPETIVSKEEIKKPDGTTEIKYTKYSNPDKTSQRISLNDNGITIIFKYSKEEYSTEEEFKKNKLIPGYEIRDNKLEKIGEQTDKEEESKNNQSKQNKEQVKLTIRYQGLQVCRVANCTEHKTLESKYRKYTPDMSKTKMHSQMFINKDETVNVKIKPFADKYGRNRLDGYGIDDKYPPYQVSPKDDISNLSIDITKADIAGKSETTLNLYEYFTMPHNNVKDFDYRIRHNIYYREEAKDEAGNDIDYGTEPLYKANITLPFRTNSDGHLNAPTMSFTNLIFKMWDKYGDFAQQKNTSGDSKNKSLDRLVIRQLNKNNAENRIVIVEHDGSLKAKELKGVEGQPKTYKFNFKLVGQDSWYKYIYLSEQVQKELELYTTVKPIADEFAHRDIIFEYYFTGKPPKPELETADYTVKYLDQDGVSIFPDYVQSLELGTIVNIEDTRQVFDGYELFKTRPDRKELIVQKDESKNIIEHYYYNKSTHTEIKYYSNGGSFGSGKPNDITNTEKTQRIVIAKLKSLLKPYNPTDISRSGYRFTGWALGSASGEKVGEDKLVENGLNLYAQWEKRTDSTITFHANGGKFTDDSTVKIITGAPGSRVRDYAPSVRRSGYSLTDWTLQAGGGQAIDNRILSEGEHLDVYAQWKKDGGGGGGGDKEDPEKPKPPVKEKEKDRRGREIGTVLEPKIEYELNKKDHFAYVKGYKDNTVQPNGYITREEVAMVFYRLMETEYREEIETTNHKFNDVKANTWSTKAIATLSNGELLKGYPDGSFKPQGKMTRGEISKLIARFTDTIVLETQMPDVIGHWAEDYINTAENKGWIKGYEDGTFRPNELLTRAEFVTMINSLLDRKVRKENILPGVKTFKDLEEMKWYYEQITESVNGHDYELERLKDGTEKWIKLVDTQYPD